jgi:GTPase
LRDLSIRQQERRKNRLRTGIPNVAIVGYTNAGKSTLLNTLTHANVLSENKLFATLAPTSRRGYLPEYGEVVFTDTVGFIRALPKDLKKAFRSTLEELLDVDVLLHVLDASADDAVERFTAVEQILSELELDKVPRLLVLNKTDNADPFDVDLLEERLGGIRVSAQEKRGIPELKHAILSAVLEHRARVAQLWEEARTAKLEYA